MRSRIAHAKNGRLALDECDKQVFQYLQMGPMERSRTPDAEVPSQPPPRRGREHSSGSYT